MANITSTTALNFSNVRVRPAADKLTQCYNRCSSALQRWNSLGGGQAAINVMQADIRAAADRLVEAYEFCFRTEKIWFLIGSGTLFPNDASVVVDGSPADSRPAETGAKVNAVMNRVVELQNWLFSGAQSFTDSARNNAATYNTVLQVSSDGIQTMAVSDGGNFINRCTELTNNYQAGSNANLGTLLAVAVNPNN